MRAAMGVVEEEHMRAILFGLVVLIGCSPRSGEVESWSIGDDTDAPDGEVGPEPSPAPDASSDPGTDPGTDPEPIRH